MKTLILQFECSGGAYLPPRGRGKSLHHLDTAFWEATLSSPVISGSLPPEGLSFPDFFVQGLYQVVPLSTFSLEVSFNFLSKETAFTRCTGQRFVIFYAGFVSVFLDRTAF